MGSFLVVPLVSQRILVVRLVGSLTLDDVALLRNAQLGAMKVVGWRHQQYKLLVDLTDGRIQDSAVASALDQLRDDPEVTPERMAFVHGTSPAKMQIRRLAAGRDDGMFLTEEEAVAWLKNGS